MIKKSNIFNTFPKQSNKGKILTVGEKCGLLLEVLDRYIFNVTFLSG